MQMHAEKNGKIWRVVLSHKLIDQVREQSKKNDRFLLNTPLLMNKPRKIHRVNNSECFPESILKLHSADR